MVFGFERKVRDQDFSYPFSTVLYLPWSNSHLAQQKKCGGKIQAQLMPSRKNQAGKCQKESQSWV